MAMNNNASEMGTVIARLRTAQGKTQGEIAESLGISDKTLSKWENGASSPTPEMIAALAVYFGVSSDVLLGLNTPSGISADKALRSEIAGSTRGEGIKNIFDHTFHMVETAYGLYSDTENDDLSLAVVPDIKDSHYIRSLVSSRDMFAMHVNSQDVNIFTALFGCEHNFSYLTDSVKAERISKLLRLLESTDAMRLIATIHSEAFPANFSSSYIAKESGVDEEKTEELLGEFCEMGICTSSTAHLATGDETIYQAFGDGRLLVILCLCYEYVWGRNSNYYYYGDSGKMIRKE